MSTRVDLMTSGSAEKARSIGMLSDGWNPRSRGRGAQSGSVCAVSHSIAEATGPISSRPRTAGATRMMPSASLVRPSAAPAITTAAPMLSPHR